MAHQSILRFSEEVTFVRPAPGDYAEGYWEQGEDDQEIIIKISIQPMSGDDLELLPEAFRTRRVCKGYTETPLSNLDEKILRRGDKLQYEGTLFEVHTVKRWPKGLDHYEVVLVEMDHQDQA
jgi:hypothetical protein